MTTTLLRALALAIVSLAPIAPQPAQAVTASDTYEKYTHYYTSVERAKRDLRWLPYSSCLDYYAERQAARMAAAHKMYHQSLSTVMSKCGLRTAGENVAYGYSSGQAVVQLGWMRSAPHKANILSKSFRNVGVGAVRDSRGVWYVAQVFGTKR